MALPVLHWASKLSSNLTDLASGIIGRGRILWLIGGPANGFRGEDIVNVREVNLCQRVLSVELK